MIDDTELDAADFDAISLRLDLASGALTDHSFSVERQGHDLIVHWRDEPPACEYQEDEMSKYSVIKDQPLFSDYEP